MPKIKIILGALLLVILTSSSYVIWQEYSLKLHVDADKSTFRIHNGYFWELYGREYNKLFDGTSKMNRVLNDTYVLTTYNLSTNKTTKIRYTQYIRGPLIVDTYKFDGNNRDIELQRFEPGPGHWIPNRPFRYHGHLRHPPDTKSDCGQSQLESALHRRMAGHHGQR